MRSAIDLGLWDRVGDGEQLIGAGADANVFGEVFPTDLAGGIDQKFRGAGDVVSFRAAARVQEMVAPDHFRVDVRKNREGVSGLLAKGAGHFGRIDADGDGLNAGGLELA